MAVSEDLPEARLTNLAVDGRIIKHLTSEWGVKELFPPQQQALPYALTGQNLMLTIPTASGKSLVAHLTLIQRLISDLKGARGLYIVPLKALASEKVEELRELASLVGLRVGIAIGDRSGETSGIDDSDILVCTSEKLDSILRTRDGIMEKIGVVVVDEFHLLHDISRGPTLEVLLSRIRHSQPDAQFIALSATVGNSEEMANWLDAKLVKSDWRPIQLHSGTMTGMNVKIHRIDGPENIHSFNDIDKNNNNEKEADHVDGAIDETIKSDEVSKENVNDKQEKSEGVLEEDINKNVKKLDEEIPDTNSAETNKIEYEEKTLEALDSVREAVTKSLEENIETQSEEIKNNTEDSKDDANEVISEISLINTLFKNIREISNEEIENVVKSKVIELAEDVIGYQIEKFPDKFLKKIKNSINEIKSINKDIKIYLNDKDFELLNKFIENNKLEITFKLELDSSLGRGDFTIDMGGVIQAIKYKKVIE